MKKLALALLLAIAPTPAWAATDARALIRQTETQYQSQSSHATFRMKVVTAAWTREMTIEAWSQGREKMLSKILAPKKDAGTATLKVGDDMWNYLPKIDRLMKIPSSLMGDKWMGSHLTNDDLVKGNKVDELYDFRVTAQTPSRVTIVATPRPDAAVVWGKIVYQLDTARHVPLSVQYYDEDGAPVRTLTFDAVRKVGGRFLPMRMRFVPVDPPGEYTEVQYESLDLDRQVPDGLFSLRSLRK